MNVCAVYDGSTITFEGSSAALEEFARSLEEVGGECSFQLGSPCKLTTPDSRVLKGITVRKIGTEVSIQLDGEIAHVTGSDKKMQILAQNIRSVSMQSEFPGSRGVRPHLHIEYHPEHFFLSATAIPCVVVLTRV